MRTKRQGSFLGSTVRPNFCDHWVRCLSPLRMIWSSVGSGSLLLDFLYLARERERDYDDDKKTKKVWKLRLFFRSFGWRTDAAKWHGDDVLLKNHHQWLLVFLGQMVLAGAPDAFMCFTLHQSSSTLFPLSTVNLLFVLRSAKRASAHWDWLMLPPHQSFHPSKDLLEDTIPIFS